MLSFGGYCATLVISPPHLAVWLVTPPLNTHTLLSYYFGGSLLCHFLSLIHHCIHQTGPSLLPFHRWATLPALSAARSCMASWIKCYAVLIACFLAHSFLNPTACKVRVPSGSGGACPLLARASVGFRLPLPHTTYRGCSPTGRASSFPS